MIKFPPIPKTDILNFIKSNISLDKNILFKRTIPLISGAIALLTGISIFIHRAFIKDRDRIFLSSKELKKFMEFLEDEGVSLDNRHMHGNKNMENCFRGCVLKSVESCGAYAKYLIKTSEDHPLKDVPYKDLLFDCNSRHALGGKTDIAAVVESIGRKVNDSINKAISKCFMENMLENKGSNYFKSNMSKSNYKNYSLNVAKNIYFVDKKLLISCLESKLSKKMGEKVDVFEISLIYGKPLINRLQEIDPNIKIIYEEDICYRGFMAIPTSFANKQEAKKLIRYYEEETKTAQEHFA